MSLKKIAAELGLSLTTVSRALNGYPEVAAATRTLVQATAERLHYKPHASARRLALGRADAVGIVFPITPSDLGDFHFLRVAAAMAQRFQSAGIDLLIISASADDELAAYQRAMAGRRVDAFVVARTLQRDERLELLTRLGMPFVAYGRSDRHSAPYAWLDFDNEAGTRLAAERLLALGHRRLGYLGGPTPFNFVAQRWKGFAKALKRAGLAVAPEALLRDVPMHRRAGFDAMQRLLALAPAQRPSAVLVDNHLAGVGAAHACLAAGVQLGRDLSLIVYDGVGDDSVIRSAVTAVHQPTAETTGTTLAELTLGLLRGEPVAALQCLRQPELLPGLSDGPPAEAGAQGPAGPAGSTGQAPRARTARAAQRTAS